MKIRRYDASDFTRTASMILRNQLSKQLWGLHGVNTMPVEDPQVQRIDHESGFGLRTEGMTSFSHKAHSPSSRPMVRPELMRGVGIIGDSISDEYRCYAPDRVMARNWVEVLASSRAFDFGEPAISTGGSRDRRFSHNWSQSGATTSSLIARGQHRGLAAQVADGAPINLVAITIGTNDFVEVLRKSRSVSAMHSALRTASANFDEILDSLLRVSTTLKFAIFTAVDLSCSPLLRRVSRLGLFPPQMASAYEETVADFNEGLRGIVAAEPHRMVLVDINRLLADIVEARPYLVGDLELNARDASNQAQHLFLSDGFHPGTIGQCLIANWFIEAINGGFGTSIPPLENEEIIRIATSVPSLSRMCLFRTGLCAALGYGRRRLVEV